MHQHVCYYIPPHMLAHMAVTRARESGEPGPAQQSARVSDVLRQRRRLSGLELPKVNPPAPSGPTKVPASSGRGSHTVGATRGSSALAVAAAAITIPQPGTHARLIYDDQQQWAYDVLDIRNEGDPAVGQQNANLA